jgi:hypothetical protein
MLRVIINNWTILREVSAMKRRFYSILILVVLSSFIHPQDVENRKYDKNVPILVKPTNHNPSFRDFREKSFYESRNNWQEIIDSTWGFGLPLAGKLNIFNQYTNRLRNSFDGFLSLGMDFTGWDSLKNHYRTLIDSTTSRGGFSAIMSNLARELRDMHTYAFDTLVTRTHLNPGTPLLLLSGYLSVEHFGAVLTALPDSSLLVLRTVPNHPLGLKAGDIILGYQGIPWKILVQELLDAGLPFLPNGIGAESAYSDFLLIGAGMNWHLFDEMDIVQYSSGDTLHFSTAPMINLGTPPMLNNEQVEMPGIPFPDFFNDQFVSYGIINNTNVGYIYLFQEWPEVVADYQFAQAVNALKDTEGLIIDMRLNFGGWALFEEAFDILFNDFSLSIEDAYRAGPTTLNLSPSGNAYLYQIDGDPNSLYDHPIAVLLGPTCISMGDLTAQRFRYHPTVKFFGKSPGASLGDNLFIENFADWSLRYSISDMFHSYNPAQYLNRQEFPINFPVWHNPDDAANSIDAVVEKARSWINSMIYAYNVTPHSGFIRPAIDALNITANVTNPYNHNINVAAIIDIVDGTSVDSLPMFDDGNHGDNLAGDGLYGAYVDPVSSENIFKINVSVTDLDSSHYHELPNASRFTTIGPVVVDSFSFNELIPNAMYTLKLYLRNDGSTATAKNVTVEVETADTNVIDITYFTQGFGDIEPGQIKSGVIARIANPNNLNNTDFRINISSEWWQYWNDSITAIITGIAENESNIPKEHSLKQNYPNPFNPSTTIEFALPQSDFVTLKVYNILGEEVAALVSERLSAGKYKYEWDAGNLASGVYLYRINASEFQEVKKMILMR